MATPTISVRVKRLAHGEGLRLPAYQTKGAAGLDLVAAVPEEHPLLLAPGERCLVPTGLVLELPAGSEAQVRPRSGLALRHGVTVLNSPGTIDADYRGEVQVILVNLGSAPFAVTRGERIAQLVVVPVVQALLVEVAEVSVTERGGGGFGSTGRTTQAKPRNGGKASAEAAAVKKPKAKARSSKGPKASRKGRTRPKGGR